ncbi:MAG TPA: serine hydrolase [Phnomibacter sp.]|nr:serine hydrolase [Phnomibacter sp.]
MQLTFKRSLAIFTILLIAGTSLLQSCYIRRAYKYRNFDLKDMGHFDTALLPASTHPFYFKQGNTNKYPKLKPTLDSLLAHTSTYAFLVIKNDSIIYENYFDGLNDSMIYPSFSVAKSFVATMVAIALKEGSIKSLQEPITNYLPSLLKRDKRFADITIQHLLDMRSGIKSSEKYDSPTSDVIKMGFTNNITPKALKLSIEKPPGKDTYKSVNTQLLGMIVESATHKKLQQYMQEKLWQPLGMESDATWNIDSRKHQQVRAFCCINATARDFAKLGRLYLNNGQWNGNQMLPTDWVNNSVSNDSMVRYGGYRNQWWSSPAQLEFSDSSLAARFVKDRSGMATVSEVLDKAGKKRYKVYYRNGAYHAEGILGQFIYVQPKNKVVIVRLGHYWQHPTYQVENLIYTIGEELK